ncbi:MAG: hypothetical protein KJS97_11475 [Alphaproteobacteria bacterium]|nr:hypothetical protein [Alphaproteobacteria bacterium]
MAHRRTTTPASAASAKTAGGARKAPARPVALAPAPGPALADALNAAAWADADAHLARACREAESLQTDLAAALAALVRREGAGARPSAARKRLAAAVDRAAFAAERIAAAARVRRLERGAEGVVAFDPQQHAPAPAAAEPARGAPVRIVAPAIVRRAGPGVEVLVRALVVSVTAKPARAAGKSRRTRTAGS